VTTVGILGGGQLGRMLALAGVPLGIRCLAVEPAPDPPAGAAATVLAAAYDDPAALADLARRCDVVTIEVEHVPVDALAWLAERLPVHPSPQVVAVAQDRLAEKQLFTRLGIPTAPYAEPERLAAGFPTGTILKRRTGGFDGRGQARLGPHAAATELATTVGALGAPALAEGVVAFERELSVVAARSPDGAIAIYPVVENRHRNGILRETVAPAPGPADWDADAGALVTQLMVALDLVGVLAVELFEVDGGLLANELAPRVHNSGHWTIEGAATSQFEQHLRAVCGLPLGDPSLRGPSAMVNLIGTEPAPRDVLALPGAHLHRYGKTARADRKLGHVTVVGADQAERDDRLRVVREVVHGSD
jgi:5-(carboxyamino)imidazole ribonucleotide synthase